MTTNDIGPLRLRAQGIAEAADTPQAAVRHLLAMQAQDYNGALWSVGLRTKNPSKKAVERAIADHEIVRTWPMRGTLHFLHADDVHWMVELLAPRATQAAQSRRVKQLGLTDTVVDEAEAIMRGALKGGKSIVRGDVVTLLQDVKGLKIDNQHTQHLMRNFGERGIICFGPNEGKQPTFVLLDEWVPKQVPKLREDALIELATRYFISHGPATLKDFAGWGMMMMRDAKFGLEGALPKLATSYIDGTVYYHEPGLKPAHMKPLLLPGFDEYLLGYKAREDVLNGEHAKKIVPGGNGMFLPTIVADGRVVGLWRKTVKARGVTHEYEFFGPASAAPDAERSYERFLQS